MNRPLPITPKLLISVVLMMAGCSNFTSGPDGGTALYTPSFTVEVRNPTPGAEIVSRPAPTHVTPASPPQSAETVNRILKSQMVDLMMENQSLKEVVGILINTDRPVDIVREVGVQIAEMDARNHELRDRIASLQNENARLQRTLVAMQKTAVETNTELAAVRARNAELESMRGLTLELQEKNQLLTDENLELQQLLAGKPQPASDPDEVERLISQIAELRTSNDTLQRSLEATQSRIDHAANALDIFQKDSTSISTLRDLTTELEIKNRLLVSQNQNLRRMLVSQQTDTSEAPVMLLSNRPEMPANKPAVSPNVRLRIYGLLPNPVGNEGANEAAIIINEGTESVTLAGWRLTDPTGRDWALDSLLGIGPGEKKTIVRNNMSMGLNNTGDMVQLLDPQQEVHDSVAYGTIAEDQWIYFTGERTEGLGLNLSQANKNQ